MTRAARFALALAAGLAPLAAAAQELSFGLVTDVDTGGIGIVGEYHATPFTDTGSWTVGFGAAARLDQDQDAWIGAGVVANYDVSDAFFLQLSFMPGYYSEGETVLGGNLHFRSLLGLGWNVTDTSALIVSIDHLSNGNLHETNPGAEAIALRYQFQF